MTARRYVVCGTVIETGWPLVTPLPSTRAAPEMRFVVTDEAPGPEREPGEQEFRSDGAVYLTMGRYDDREVLRFPGSGDAWFIGADTIVFHLRHPEHDHEVELLLLGALVAVWLERRGRVTLHGSAAGDDGWAAGFLGPNGAGKTSLALGMLADGGRLVTDDLLAVAVDDGAAWALPSFPQVRLWPDDARRFRGSAAGFQLAHPNYGKLRIPLDEHEFAQAPAPLRALYRPQRDPTATGVRIEPVPGPVALLSLLSTSSATEVVDTPEHRPAWVRRMGAVLHHAPLYRLVYPDAHDAAPEVAAAVRKHVAALEAGRTRVAH